MTLQALLYMSNPGINLAEADVLEIWETAKRENSKRNITGMLLYGENSFLQMIEGEAAQIDQLFANIEKDTRHSNVRLLSKSEIDKRTFADWSMGYKRLDKAEKNDLASAFGWHFDQPPVDLLSEPHETARFFSHIKRSLLER